MSPSTKTMDLSTVDTTFQIYFFKQRFFIYLRNNLEYVGDDRFNPMGTGFLFLFSGSVFVGNITEYRRDGHSWHFLDMDTQEAIGFTVSRLSRLFHALQTRRGGGLRSRSASCFRCFFLNEQFCILINISLKFVPKNLINNNQALV